MAERRADGCSGDWTSSCRLMVMLIRFWNRGDGTRVAGSTHIMAMESLRR